MYTYILKKNNTNNVQINKLKLTKSSSTHKNPAFKSPLLKVNKTGHGISKSFRSPLINGKDRIKNNGQGIVKTKTSVSSLPLKNRNINRSNTTQLLKFKKDKELLSKIKERDSLLNELKQREENIRRINLVLKHRETVHVYYKNKY